MKTYTVNENAYNGCGVACAWISGGVVTDAEYLDQSRLNIMSERERACAAVEARNAGSDGYAVLGMMSATEFCLGETKQERAAMGLRVLR